MSDGSSRADGAAPARPRGTRALRLLRSPRLALFLLLGIALLAIPGTLFQPAQAEQFFRSHVGPALLPALRALGLVDPYRSPLFASLLVLLCASVAACTAHRLRPPAAPGERPPWPGGRLAHWADLLLHLSVIVILAGATAKGLWGFTATQIVLPGRPQQTVFDVRTQTDVPLGFTILLRDVEETYYPIRARIGVANAATGDKVGLVEVVEGRPLPVPAAGVTLALEGYDPGSQSVTLAVVQGGRREPLRLETRERGVTTAAAAGHRFTLVAYFRELRTIRGLVTILDEGRPDRTAWISPTDPVTHRGTHLYQTAWGVHPEHGRYLGLQVGRDPWAPLFWGGCVLLGVSVTLLVVARLRLAARPRTGAARPGT